MYCNSCLDDAPGKFIVLDFLFFINLLRSYIRNFLWYAVCKTKSFAAFGFAFAVLLYLSLPEITGNLEKIFPFSG